VPESDPGVLLELMPAVAVRPSVGRRATDGYVNDLAKSARSAPNSRALMHPSEISLHPAASASNLELWAAQSTAPTTGRIIR